MYRENYKTSLQYELIELVSKEMTPIALKYRYSEAPLESTIKWRPTVLILGNYSSGKSTLINELIGADIQDTGQAPTDDSFTVITYDDSSTDDPDIRVTEEHDGRHLLSDPEYPFEKLKNHGRRFASHFRLKKVNSPFLAELAIIDTPGMLDSVTERDRGYNYQDVIGDLARIADLILVLFDPHKAGTVQETYVALRETLPANTFEERVLFVLNRIDECETMTDLLKVYGTLCWNLSQMTGRKDIPEIHLTYSSSVSEKSGKTDYLTFLQNQREDLKRAIMSAPDFRLDHLASFVENHSENLDHYLETLMSYGQKIMGFNIRFNMTILILSLASGFGLVFLLAMIGFFAGMPLQLLLLFSAGLSSVLFLLGIILTRNFFRLRFHQKLMNRFDDLTPLENQRRKDVWESIRPFVYSLIDKEKWNLSFGRIRRDYETIHDISTDGVREIRLALNELTCLPDDVTDEPMNEELKSMN
jgi:GTPase SAR1 family protein